MTVQRISLFQTGLFNALTKAPSTQWQVFYFISIYALISSLVLANLNAQPTSCPTREMPPTLQGVIDAKLDIHTAQKWIQFREQREQERILEAFDPQRVIKRYQISAWEIDQHCIEISALVDIGRGIFLRKFSRQEGYGHRLSQHTYQRFQSAKRGGPDASACEDCHWKGGFAGSGDRVDQSYLEGDGDQIDTHESRNPPHLWGLGWVELLAQEMSQELQALALALQQEALVQKKAKRLELLVQGISFGWLSANALGELDFHEVEGIDHDLIIKPFAWKGVFAKLRDFIHVSLQKHFSLQATELIALNPPDLMLGPGQRLMFFLPSFYAHILDPDLDGVIQEISAGQSTALVAFLATLDTPSIEIPTYGSYQKDKPFGELEIVDSPELAWRWQEGNKIFDEIGCTGCHIPYLRLKSPIYNLTDRLSIDLSKQAATPIPQMENGYYLIPLFSDLKRHKMGQKLRGKIKEKGVDEETYLTRRLWGFQQSAPYLHTGEALTLDEAVQGHLSEGSEASFAAENYLQLTEAEKSAMRVYLQALKRLPSIRIR